MFRTLYLIHHSHTDLGYTHAQPVVRHLHCSYIDAALREIERTRDYPIDARMRWTCETLYPVFDWLRQASAEERELFCSLEHEGLIEVTACWEIVTQSSPPRAWQWMLDRVEQARGEYGFTIRSAMLSDINGAPWALPDMLSSRGIRNFSMSINEHFGRSIFPRLKPFRWRGPKGGVLNTFNGLHYNNNQYFGIPYDLTRARSGVQELKNFLDSYPGFDLDFAVFQVTRPDFNDNGAPDPRLPDFVRAWNEAGFLPRMEIVTLSGFFDAVGPGVFDRQPEVSGEWTDFWNFGAASTPYETALNRRTYRLLEEVEALSKAGEESPHVARLLDNSLENAVFHDEHTWGSDSSVSAPHADAARSGLHFKNDFAYRAHASAQAARAEALAALTAAPLATDAGQHLLVFHAGDEVRSAAVEVPVEWLLSDVCPTPTHLHRMQQAPIQWPPVTVAQSTRAIPAAFQGASNLRLDITLNPREVRALSANEIFASAVPSSPAIREIARDQACVENAHYAVRLDPETGGLLSLIHQVDGRELLAPGLSPSGVPLREEPEGKTRAEIHPTPDWTKFMGYKGWNTRWRARRQPATPSGRTLIETMPGRKVLRQEFSSPHARTASLAVILDDATDAVGFEVTVDFCWNSDPCAWYWPLAFALETPSFVYDNCGVSVKLGRDQLPGANSDYQTVHRWIRVREENRSVLLFPLDTPLVCLGGFSFGRMTSPQTPRTALVAPMLQSNYWDTNYAASCNGAVTFRFFLADGESAPTEEDANRLAFNLEHPPLIVPFAAHPDSAMSKKEPLKHPCPAALESYNSRLTDPRSRFGCQEALNT